MIKSETLAALESWLVKADAWDEAWAAYMADPGGPLKIKGRDASGNITEEVVDGLKDSREIDSLFDKEPRGDTSRCPFCGADPRTIHDLKVVRGGMTFRQAVGLSRPEWMGVVRAAIGRAKEAQ